MSILKIGNLYINWDQVTDVEFMSTKATVHLSSQGEREPRSIQFRDEEAEALRKWLDGPGKANDILNPKSRKPISHR